MMRTVLAIVATALILAASATTATAQDDELPVKYSALQALIHATTHPDTAPPGANDWSCESGDDANPVVLVHGTTANMTVNWDSLSPLLHNEGYCVFAFNYGQVDGLHVGLPGSSELTNGAGPIPDSAGQLKEFVDTVLDATGSDEVDIVGHSQGGMMPRWYVQFLDGAAKVDKLIALSPSNHGTTVDGLAQLPGVEALLSAGLGPAVRDQVEGSDVLSRLNAGAETVDDVDYTVIQTKFDEIVTPYTSAFLESDAPNVDNILVQDQCPSDVSEHLSIAFDPIALHDVVNALDPENATEPDCSLVLPGEGAPWKRWM